MTRLDLQTRLQNHFNNPTYYSSQDINDSIQDGYDEVAAFTGCIWASTTLPFTANTTYYDFLTLIPNYIGVYAIFNATIRRWLYPTSLKKLWQNRIDWDTNGGTPYYFVPVNHRYVAIWMKPLAANYGNMYVFYRASAPTLADNTVISIPDDHLTALESYSIQDLWEQAQEFGKADEYFDTYTTNIEKLRIQMRNQRNSDRYPSLR